MRLLDAKSITLHEFQGSKIPRYAILSHTWGDDEVSFQDLQAGKGPGKEGYKKIVFTCKQALLHGLEWVWVDTCCIDKSSSAELSESINSMYRWYEESAMCYAYLVDIVDINKFPYAPSTNNRKQQISRWFTRSWTLQELIASQRLYFFGHDWKIIGPCSGRLSWVVSDNTGIPIRLIDNHSPLKSLSDFSAAQKMSWAANRSSTRPEDIAYSLLGLFNISMPLLYGEGERAFIRLQEEILRETDDHSLLCWTVPESDNRAWTLQSVFATSPDSFSEAGEIKGNLFDSGHPSAVTNRGLQIYLPLMERHYGTSSHLYRENAGCVIFDAALDAGEYEPVRGLIKNQILIPLIRTPQITSRHLSSVNRYARLATSSLRRINIGSSNKNMARDARTMPQLIYIHKSLFDWERDRFGLGGIHLQNIYIASGLLPMQIMREIKPLRFLRIKTVQHSRSYEILRDVAIQGLFKNWAPGITWSPTYGCVIFDDTIGHIGNLTRSFCVVFGIGFFQDSGTSFSILLARSGDYLHFSLLPTEIQMANFDKFRCQAGEQDDEPMAHEIQSSTNHPNNISTNVLDTFDVIPPQISPKKYHCETYGEIARTRATIESQDVELILEREDPNTKEGEAAGNRLHFLIRAIDR